MDINQINNILRSEMSKFRIPTILDKVYKDECVFSYDTPYSSNGIYINLSTLLGYGKDYLEYDVKTNNGKVYLQLQYEQILSENNTSLNHVPSKLAIGTKDGFQDIQSTFDVIKYYAIVIVNSMDDIQSFTYPNNNIPEYISNVIEGILSHNGMRSNIQIATWDADNEKYVSKYALDLTQTNPRDIKIPQDPKLWKDEETNATENLWLNLSTGYIGGGRKNWDGTGGSGSALKHFQDTGGKYPLCVKLGTITPYGADVWSYAEDEDALVIDPNLSEHLSFWGIDIMKLEKTEKSLSEMEVSLNMSYDWSRILDGHEQLEPVAGQGYKGLRNIGSSCYMNAVIQTILAIPEVRKVYVDSHVNIVSSAPADPSTDFLAQFSKLAVGLYSNRYISPPNPTTTSGNIATISKGGNNSVEEDGGRDLNALEKYVVAPYMFKHVVSKGNMEFSSGRQQDVSEYYQYFLQVLQKAEKAQLMKRIISNNNNGNEDNNSLYTASLFEFHVETRIQCQITGDVKYGKIGQQSLYNLLDLRVPLEKAIVDVIDIPHSSIATNGKSNPSIVVSSSTGDAALSAIYKRARIDDDVDSTYEFVQSSDVPQPSELDSNHNKENETFIPFTACLDSFLQPELIDIYNPKLGCQTTCDKTLRFKTFPRYLMLKVARYYAGANWIQQKINSRIDVPEYLDLSMYRGKGLAENETLISDEEPTSTTNGTAATAALFNVDANLVQQLVSMGFSENGSKRAAIATNNADADIVINWVFEHMEDPDFNDPPILSNTTTSIVSNVNNNITITDNVNADAIEMLCNMGYTREQTTAALRATDNDIERAADWLFSHADDLQDTVAQIQASQPVVSGKNHSFLSTQPSLHLDTTTNSNTNNDNSNGKYALLAIISHIGKSTDHGHYVCHIKKDDQWILYNDEKVGKCTKAPVHYGFMYLYKQCDEN